MEEVSGWQTKLSIADQVITVWFEVQRTWMHLESIFMSSEDIRKQLPEDAERFDNIDRDFKVSLRFFILFIFKLLLFDVLKENICFFRC